MEIKELKISGTFEVVCKPIGDERGFFMRSYDDKTFKNFNINHKWVQENHSKTEKKGTIRGLHFQLPPFAETKLVRVVRGEVLDVFVDLRKDSKTFGHYDSIVLSEKTKNQVLVPRGFAHSFCTLSDSCEVVYKTDSVYSPKHEIGMIWDDKDLKIKWPTINPILSEKDKNNISFSDFLRNYGSVNLKKN